ncbi:MAG: ProQ/FINO family protein [Methylobacter sp.]|jgi:sRNA-binding protein
MAPGKTHCSGKTHLAYRECLAEDAVRVDLDGNALGLVSKIEAEQARKLK